MKNCTKIFLILVLLIGSVQVWGAEAAQVDEEIETPAVKRDRLALISTNLKKEPTNNIRNQSNKSKLVKLFYHYIYFDGRKGNHHYAFADRSECGGKDLDSTKIPISTQFYTIFREIFLGQSLIDEKFFTAPKDSDNIFQDNCNRRQPHFNVKTIIKSHWFDNGLTISSDKFSEKLHYNILHEPIKPSYLTISNIMMAGTCAIAANSKYKKYSSKTIKNNIIIGSACALSMKIIESFILRSTAARAITEDNDNLQKCINVCTPDPQ